MTIKKPLSLTEQLVNHIRQDILNNVYPPNTPLRQDALAEKYEVSRIPIREALLQLEAEELLTIIPHKGAIVTPLSISEINDVFELRLMLEPRLYRASATKLTRKDLDKAATINQHYQLAVEQQKNELLGELNADLHMSLYKKAELPKTQHIVEALLKTSERYSRIHLRNDELLSKAAQEHDQLLTLTYKQQFAKAEMLLIDHLEKIWKDLVSVIK